MGGSFESVLVAAQEGAEWAWRSLYDELAGPIEGYLRIRGARDPEDLVGEVFVQLARNIEGFSGDGAAFRSWAFLVAHHRLIDDRRRWRRRPEAVVGDENFPVRSAADDPEAEALDRLSTERIRSLFSVLSPDQRDVLSLRIIGGLTLKETALAVGKRVGAVKALQRRGLDAVRREVDRSGVSL